MKRIFLLILLSGCAKFDVTTTKTPPTPSSDCEITISDSGTYTLDRNLTAEYCGVRIVAHKVTLNMNGHTITGPYNNNKMSFGIINEGYSDVTIENGTITGFLVGVRNYGRQSDSSDTKNNVVRHMNVHYSGYRAIQIGGYFHKAEYNVVTNTGGSSALPNNWNFGIDSVGAACNVSNNTVLNTYPSVNDGGNTPSEAVGISFSHFNSRCVAENNQVLNDILEPTNHTYGFWIELYSPVTLKNNKVRNFYYQHAGNNDIVLIDNDFEVR